MSQASKKIIIGLMGCEVNSPNKGCEALSYAFIELLKDVLVDVKIHFIIFYEKCSLDNIRMQFPEYSFECVPIKLKDLSLISYKKLHLCDYIFDVTMGDSFSDIYSEELCRVLIHHKRAAEIVGKKYILLPQTYGPFKNKKLESEAAKVIHKADRVFSRDQISSEFVRNICNRDDVIQVPDMAFMLNYNPEEYCIDHNLINIGLNVSGLLWKGGFSDSNQFKLKFDYRDYIKTIIEWLCAQDKYKLHLISHVVDLNEDSYDDDYKVLSDLNSKYSTTVLAPPFSTPIQAKSYISGMDCFIGARMHSTIAAFSSRTATVPFSYSRKFEGLFGTLGYKYIIHGNSDSLEQAISKTKEYIENYHELRKCCEESLITVEQGLKRFRVEINKIFECNGSMHATNAT